MLKRILYVLDHPIVQLSLGFGMIGAGIYELIYDIPDQYEKMQHYNHWGMMLLGLLLILKCFSQFLEGMKMGSERWEHFSNAWYGRLGNIIASLYKTKSVMILCSLLLIVSGFADAGELVEKHELYNATWGWALVLYGVGSIGLIFLGVFEGIDEYSEEADEAHKYRNHLICCIVRSVVAVFVIVTGFYEEAQDFKGFTESESQRVAMVFSGLHGLRHSLKAIQMSIHAWKHMS